MEESLESIETVKAHIDESEVPEEWWNLEDQQYEKELSEEDIEGRGLFWKRTKKI